MIHPKKITVYCDVDGTLVSETNVVSPLVKGKVAEFVQRGFRFSLATGRSFSAVQRLLREIPCNAPLVLCNGSFVYDPSQNRARWVSLNKDLLVSITQELILLPHIRLYMDRSDHTLWVSHEEALLDPFVKQENLQPRVWKNIMEVFETGDILKLGIKLIQTPEEIIKQITAILSSYTAAYPLWMRWCYSSHNYIEVMPAGVSKWSGILIGQQMSGIRESKIYTVGDHYNDLEMIQNADLGVAMGNAVEEVKRTAAHQIGHVTEDAVADFLADLMSHEDPVSSLRSPRRVALSRS
jgi:Cof subfamily protein (haloacid dehalogenase superfamily)